MEPEPKPQSPQPKPRKTYLSKSELDEFRGMLVQKRRTLLGDLSGMKESAAGQNSSGNLSTMPTHMADVGSDTFEHEFTLGLMENEQSLLREIDEALKRIEDKTYGICLGTGEPIPKPRLKAKPWAKYTVDYSRMLEKGLVRAPDASTGRDDDGEPGEEPDEPHEVEVEEDEDVAVEEPEAEE